MKDPSKQRMTIHAGSMDDLDTVMEYVGNALQDLEDSGDAPVGFLYETEPVEPSEVSYTVLLAERSAVISEYLCEHGKKLSSKGFCNNYNAIATLAARSFDQFPSDFDWDRHIGLGGDCWDIEIGALALRAARELDE